jgi:magnesium chelatase family protein
VVKARNIQQQRFAGTPIHCNAQMSAKQVRKYCRIDEAGDKLLRNAMDKFGLSARAYDRILKVARTIADLDGANDITSVHLMEAISYRQLDRDTWGE